MAPETYLTDTTLFSQLCAAFKLTQGGLGKLLGLSPAMMSHIRTGRRSLPQSAYVPLTHMVLALQAAPPLPDPAPAPPPLDPADLTALSHHALACRATAARLVLEQAALAARAAWAAQRLAVLPVLAAAVPALATTLPPDPCPNLDTGFVPGPRWLAHFEEEAREALVACGPLAQARLALRRAALLHEVALTERLLAGEPLAAVVPAKLGELG